MPTLSDMTDAEIDAISDMTDAEIDAKLANIHKQNMALYDERQQLECEKLHRASAERGETLIKLFAHESFGLSFDVRMALRIRIPDFDWIEGDDEAEALRGKALDFASGTVSFGGYEYRVTYPDDHVHLCPNQSDQDEAAWKVLIDAALPRLDRLKTLWSMESADVLMKLLRALPPRTP